jgi:hypothetical protein
MDLTAALTPTPVGEGTFVVEIADGWQQGRGAYGGIVLGLLTRACALDPRAEGRPLRSLTAAIPAPTLVGRAEITVQLLRAGTGVTTLAATLTQGGGVTAHAVAVMGRSRTADRWCDRRAPTVPAWKEVPALPATVGFPRFAEQFEWRPILPPFTGAAPRSLGWIRPLEPGPLRDAAFVVAMADAWWPASFGRFTGLRGSATVAFTLQLGDGWDTLDPDAPWLHTGHAELVCDGYVQERRELWGEDGRLIAINPQTFALQPG